MKQLKEIIETIQEQHASKYSIYYERLAKELNVISKNEQIKNTLLFLCDVNDCLEDTFGRYYFRGELNNSLLCYYLLNLCNDPIKDGLVFELAFEKKRFWLPSLQLSTRTFEALVQFLLEFYDVFLLNEDEKQYQRMGSVEEEREIYDFLIMPKHHCVTDENDYNCIYIYVFVDKRLDLLEVLNSRKQKDEYTEKELEAIFKTFNCISDDLI